MSVMEMLKRMNELENEMKTYESKNKNSALRQAFSEADPDLLRSAVNRLDGSH